MDSEPSFKVHNSVSVHPKNIILGQMTNLNMIVHVVVSVYQFAKIWNSPQFPAQLRNGQYNWIKTNLSKFLGIFVQYFGKLHLAVLNEIL